jgi:membrane-bound serine protease (ClpP class)
MLPALFGGVARAKEKPVAYIMRVSGTISPALAEAVKRKIAEAEQNGAKTFILELDTPGGDLGASISLGDFIFQQQDLDTVAYVHSMAYSGGTMLALACKEIYIDALVGRMGDVAPVDLTGQIVGEKFQVAVRETMLTYARARGYPEALVKGMVTPEIEVFRIQTTDDPRPAYVTGGDLDARTEEQRSKIVKKELIVPAGQLLAMDATKAVEYGFAKKAVRSPEELFDTLQVPEGGLRRVYLSASEKLLAFLDVFSPMFIVAGFILLFIEISHPGFGLPGILGIACFAVFFLIKWTLHYAALLEVVLFAIGLVLLVIEVFFIPGFGVVGITGIVLMFISLVLMFQEFVIPTTPREATSLFHSVLQVTGALAMAIVGIAILLRYLPALPVLGRMVLRHSLAQAHAGEGEERRTPGLALMAGQVGVALSPLRPAGRAQFEDKLLHVVTEGDFVEKGAEVQVIQVAGSRVVVKPYRRL